MVAEDSAVLYLHGDLELHIIESRSLPNMDLFSSRLRRCFTACHTAASEDESDRKLHHHGKIITSDPYVTVSVPQATLARTRVISNSQNPKWNERFHIPLAHPVVNLDIRVKDNDVFGADTIGKILIPADKISAGDQISGWFPIIAASGKPPKPDTALRIKMLFTPCDKNPLYKHGVAGDPNHRGVRNTYFPLRKGSAVTLYQDAHVIAENIPKIDLDDGLTRNHSPCWEDICYAVAEAHHLIYITGWSVFHKINSFESLPNPCLEEETSCLGTY